MAGNFRADLVREVFKKTPKMSTYLVALVVSEFECRETDTKAFGVCSRPNAYNQTGYSFEVGQKTLEKYDELFNYPYNSQMDKLHMIAIPDFVSGAMENWGMGKLTQFKLSHDFALFIIFLNSLPYFVLSPFPPRSGNIS